MTVHLDGWAFDLPDGAVGGPARHDHTHLVSLAVWRRADLEVIATTYPTEPIGEHGESLDDGDPWEVPGATTAVRREQRTHLDTDPEVPPVDSILVTATGPDGSIVLVTHRPLGADPGPSEAVVGSLHRAG